MSISNLIMSWHVCWCLFSHKVPGRISKWKMLPQNVFMYFCCLLLFMRNLFLLHQQLAIVLVARIRLLWILEVFILLGRCCHHHCFHPYWISPPVAESWFEIHLHQCHFPETLFHRNMQMDRQSFNDLLYMYVDDPITDGGQGTKDFLAWQNFYSL